MKHILTAIILTVTCLKASAQWAQKTSNTVEDLTAVTFIDSNTGFVCGAYNTLLKTTDGGRSWRAIHNSTIPIASYMSVDALDANHIFVARNGLFVSQDGGASFSQWGTWNSSAYAIQSIKATNDSTVFITKGGYILKSSDRGATWNALYYDEHLTGPMLFTGNNDTAYAASGTTYDATSYGSIHKSTDGGNTWHDLNLTTPQVIALYFRNATTGYYAAFGNTLYKTTDGGTSWSTMNSPVGRDTDYITGILFLNDTLGYITTLNGAIYKTLNAGTNWSVDHEAHKTNGNYDIPLNAITELSNHQIIVIGNSGTILKKGGPLSTPDVKFHPIAVYPNPASLYLEVNLNTNAGQYRHIELYNAVGANVSRQEIRAGQQLYKVDVSQLSRGLYLLKISGIYGDYLEKIIIR